MPQCMLGVTTLPVLLPAFTFSAASFNPAQINLSTLYFFTVLANPVSSVKVVKRFIFLIPVSWCQDVEQARSFTSFNQQKKNAFPTDVNLCLVSQAHTCKQRLILFVKVAVFTGYYSTSMPSIELTSIASGFNSDIKGINMKEKSLPDTTTFSFPSYSCISKK